MQRIWSEALAEVRQQVRAFEHRTWFKSLKPVALERGQFTIQVKDAAFQNCFVERYEPLLLAALEKAAGMPVSCDYRVVEPELFDPPAAQEEVAATSALVIPENTFEGFVVGPSNHMAYAAGKAASERPGKAYNPLFIYGGTGLGKTHLLHAIAQHARKRRPNLRVLYITAETYFNDMMVSIRLKNMEHFRVKYRDACDMLLVDDIQFLAGKPRSQEEFFHTFNALHAAGKQIAFTSDRVPQEIPEIEDRLKSRFEWGLIADINPPELETRVAILKVKADLLGLAVPDDVLMLIAQKVRDNVRELESCIRTLHLISSTSGEPITVPLVQERLKGYFKSRVRKTTVEQVQRAVALRYGVTEEQIRSHCRQRSFAQPRHVAVYLCRRLTPLSFPELGQRFGGRDHTSVMASCRKVDKLRKVDSSLQQTLDELEQKLSR